MSEIFTVVWLIFVICFSAFISVNKKKNKDNFKENIRTNRQSMVNRADVSSWNQTSMTSWNHTNNNTASINNMSNVNNAINKSEDYTCETRYNHTHRPEYSMPNRYVVHEQPIQGYIVLNGKRYSKKELKNK
ncbi:hypothetical protein [Lachnospira multipara]|uniref:Uncharacterized protein n=1 Tax=Lachnospira multipara TaxID=28051 RepID=A0A1H5V0L0_9FIRM|nr:hypothetical protein [Lachnospira multipara]SEF80756.1 hypothetical protein SAMN05216537_10942 [Lachnospira multipara]